MKKITNEIKAKYYNQYQFSHVCFEGIRNSIWNVGVSTVFGYYITNGDRGKIDMDNVSALELTPLGQISDDDCQWIANSNIVDFRDGLIGSWNGKELSELYDSVRNDIELFIEYTQVYQYLQSKGYALPFGDYSVEDLVKLGVIKLK